MNKQLIPVFFSCDDAYAPYLAVAIKSLTENGNTDEHEYEINVLNTDISEDNKKKILGLAKDGYKIIFRNVSKQIEKIEKELASRLRDYYSLSIYYRIFIPNLFKEYDKVLYLDADIAIVDDVAKLYNIEMGDDLLAGTTDGVVRLVDEFKTYVVDAVGVDKWEDYINSGVLVMNTKGLREAKIEEKFLYLLTKYNFDTVAPDQDYLNALCKNRITHFEKYWDFMPNVDPDYKDEDLHLIHYNMFQKPWNYPDMRCAEYFYKYAKMTDYYEFIKTQAVTDPEERKAKEQADKDGAAGMIVITNNIINDPNNFRRIMSKEDYSEIDD
ncbi:MAG: glycosyltransferase family 8 protein [Bacilli bacterium]|nr:glycosyltransferase family 8 protein [Bacilli bacterium]